MQLENEYSKSVYQRYDNVFATVYRNNMTALHVTFKPKFSLFKKFNETDDFEVMEGLLIEANDWADKKIAQLKKYEHNGFNVDEEIARAKREMAK